MGFPGSSVVKNLLANTGDSGDVGLIPGSGRFPWRGKRQLTPVFLAGKSHRQRSQSQTEKVNNNSNNSGNRMARIFSLSEHKCV